MRDYMTGWLIANEAWLIDQEMETDASHATKGHWANAVLEALRTAKS